MQMPWSGLFQTDGYHPSEIEDSIVLRVLVFLTIAVAIGATAQATESSLSLPLIGISGSLAGTLLSWHRRRAKNWWIKLILALLMLVALASFFGEIGDNPYDARLPLAHLLIWLQVLHSFDLPRRKDVFYSLWVALILISVAATTSRDVIFGIFVCLYAILSLLSLLASHLSSQKLLKPPRGFWLKFSLPVLALTLGGSFLLFLVMPRYEGMKLQTFPVSMKMQNLPFFNGQIKNQSYPTRSGSAGDKNNSIETQGRRPFDPNAYYGFSTQLDLNYRGELSDEVVMRVRSNRASYWRGMAFDRYDGLHWTMAYPYELRRINTSVLPMWIRESRELKKNIVRQERVVQTFYIEKDQSNLVFKSPYAEQLFFPTDYVLMDNYGSIRSPIELFEDTTYTVISDIPIFEARSLSQVSWKQVSEFQNNPKLRLDPNYLEVPASLPRRVLELTHKITQGTKTPFEAVKALERHLKQHYPYNLKIPEFPENRDSIDYFLFEQKEGYCEHFATSLAIMVRSLGLGSRLVTGYTPGRYNPITGYFEVRSSDAHGWVEIYFPHHGWVPFDPTPGFLAALEQENMTKEANGLHLLDYLKQIMPPNWKIKLEQALETGAKLLAGVFGFSIGLLTWLPLPTLMLLVAITTGAVLIWVFWHRKRAETQPEIFKPTYASDPERQHFVKSYQELLSHLHLQLGLSLEPGQTPHEAQLKLKQQLNLEQQQTLKALTDYYYLVRYSQEAIIQQDLQKWLKTLHNLRTEVSKQSLQAGR